LIANAFLCTFTRDSREEVWAKNNIPSINFDDMYSEHINEGPKVAKIRMMINYFRRISKKMPQGNVTFIRQYLSAQPNWNDLDVSLTNLTVHDQGGIEDSPEALQADFANAFIGGASISYGCVQEEIRFSLCPECNVSRLFCEKMNDNEAVVIVGAEQFSSYKGYAYSLEYGGDYVDINRHETGEIKTQLVAMDALIFSYGLYSRSQWNKDKIIRELKKAYVAFQMSVKIPVLASVSTGNWGCGAFHGLQI
jgi:poly(ADP-ribose) glycohydrolase